MALAKGYRPVTFDPALLDALLARISPTGPAAEDAARARLDQLTKPRGSLGRLEEIAAKVARVQGTDHPSVERKAILLMAADHGVVAQGVSPFPQEVTWQMVANFASGGAAINQLAASVGAELRLHDVGVAADTSALGDVEQIKVAPGTADMSLGPAMTRQQAAEAILAGARAAERAIDDGVTLLGTGEMGIGNTTAAAALTAAYCGVDPTVVVGPGTGLPADALPHKAAVIARSLDVNDTGALDPLGVLAAVGGLEIAALAGVMLGAAARRTCVVVDGFISGGAALAAVSLAPHAADYLFPSHRSAEPGHSVVLDHLGMQPVLELDMRLGEGTGAALAMGIIDASCRMLSGMATFAEAGVAGAGEPSA